MLRLEESSLPPSQRARCAVGGRRIRLQQLVGGVARLLDQRDVALEIGKAQQRHARLPRAEEFARAANRAGPGARSRSRRCSRR